MSEKAVVFLMWNAAAFFLYPGGNMKLVMKKSAFMELAKALNGDSFEKIKADIIAHLKNLEKKENQSDLKKAIEHFNELERYPHLEKSVTGELIEKAVYGIGTVRIWKEKKYKKIAPNKWVRVYDKVDRGAKNAMTRLIHRAEKINTPEEMFQFVLANKQRFVDERTGRPLDIVNRLNAVIDGKNKEESKTVTEQTKNNVPKAKKEQGDKETSVFSNKDLSDRVNKGKKLIDEYLEKYLGDKNISQNLLDLYAVGDAKRYVSVNYNGTFYKNLSKEQKKQASEFNEKLEQVLEEYASKRLAEKQNNTSASETKTAAFGLNDIKTGKTVKNVEEIENVARQIAEEYKDNGKKASSVWMDFLAYNLEGGIGGDLYSDFLKKHGDLNFNVLAKKLSGKKLSSNEKKDIGFADEYANKEEETTNSKKQTIKDIRDKYESSKSVTGNKKTVTLPDGTKIKCHYKIVEADAPTASHDEKTFSPSAGFPTTKDGKSVNDRDYQNDADAQESVRKIASNFNSLALNSPPIVTKDGIVISGNNRTMSSKLAAKMGTDKAYLQDLYEMADEYGIEPEDLKDFKNPRLILETDEEHTEGYTTEEFAKFNRDTKKTMNNVEKAVKLTKTLNADKIQSIAESLQGYDTMGELYADVKGCQEFVNKLITAGIIGENEKAQYCRTDGTLNDTGKDFCETVLVGSVLNEDNIRKLDGAGGKRIRQKLVRAILPLIENKGTGKEYSFNTELNDAVNIAVTVAKDHDKFPDVKTYLSQGNLFGEKKPDAATSRLAEIIHDEGEKAFAQRMKDLGAGLRASATGEQDIFLGGVESKESLLDRFLQIKKSIVGFSTYLKKSENSLFNYIQKSIGILKDCHAI